jgi:hypothetical protein
MRNVYDIIPSREGHVKINAVDKSRQNSRQGCLANAHEL